MPFRILEATEPILQVATGEGVGKDIVFSAEGVDLLYADKVGHQHYCYWSFSGIPSISQRLTLQMGNSFQNLYGCLIDTMPAQGWMQRHHNIANLHLPDGATVYTQTICVWPKGAHGMPLHTSGLQTSTYRF